MRSGSHPGRRDLIVGGIGVVAGATVACFRPTGEPAVRAFLARNPAFLADNPDLVDAAAAVVDTRDQARRASTRKALIDVARTGLLNPLSAPCLGPLQGQLALIEFTDYLCAPCRGSSAPVAAALAARPESRAMVLLVPISGALSDYMAAFAAAAYFARPAAFPALHRALMEGAVPDQERMERAAAALGHDIDALARSIDAPQVRAYLAAARRFAEQVGVRGLPVFLNAGGRLQAGGVTRAQADRLLG